MPSALCHWSIEWNSPYTQPPEGQPRILAEVTLPRGEEPKDLYQQHVLGSGYGIHFRAIDDKPPRRLSEATKQSIRRKCLVRRMTANVPLFAQAAIASALEKNAEYYGHTPTTERTK